MRRSPLLLNHATQAPLAVPAHVLSEERAASRVAALPTQQPSSAREVMQIDQSMHGMLLISASDGDSLLVDLPLLEARQLLARRTHDSV